jgi:hypothetical protein
MTGSLRPRDSEETVQRRAWQGVCVPKTLSTLCDQAVFVDEAAGVSPSADSVPVEIDWFR